MSDLDLVVPIEPSNTSVKSYNIFLKDLSFSIEHACFNFLNPSFEREVYEKICFKSVKLTVSLEASS